MKHTLVLLLALVCLPSGGCEEYQYTQVGTYRIHWNTQRDRRLPEVLSHCEESLGLSFDPGATIWFSGPQPEDAKVAGLYHPDTDLIELYEQPCLDATALCHELLHRYITLHSGSRVGCIAATHKGYEPSCLRWARPGNPDYNHTRPEWKYLPGSKYCPLSSSCKPKGG